MKMIKSRRSPRKHSARCKLQLKHIVLLLGVLAALRLFYFGTTVEKDEQDIKYNLERSNQVRHHHQGHEIIELTSQSVTHVASAKEAESNAKPSYATQKLEQEHDSRIATTSISQKPRQQTQPPPPPPPPPMPHPPPPPPTKTNPPVSAPATSPTSKTSNMYENETKSHPKLLRSREEVPSNKPFSSYLSRLVPPEISTQGESRKRLRPAPTTPPEWEQSCASEGGKIPPTPHSGFFRNVAPQSVTDVAPDMPIPVVVITSNRIKYISKVIESLRHADSFGDAPDTAGVRTCIFIKDKTHRSSHSSVDEIILGATDFCDVRVITNDKDASSHSHRGWHLVHHWVWIQEQVWSLDQDSTRPGYKQSVATADGGRLDIDRTRKLMEKRNQSHLPSLKDYNGDILFLEDDAIVSPDVFACLNFMSQVKALGTQGSGGTKGRPIESPYAIGLGGWNAENMWGPHPLDFRVLVSIGLPTLGYAHNRSLYEDLILHAKPPDSKPRQVDNDWTSAILQLVERNPDSKHAGADDGGHDHPSYGHVPILRPTLSRVWHIGSQSSVGNSHARHIKSCPPWAGISPSSLMTTNAVPKITELKFTEVVREQRVSIEMITQEEAHKREQKAAGKYSSPDDGRPLECLTCKSGDFNDGGRTLDSIDGSCHYFCSPHGYCGTGLGYSDNGVDCHPAAPKIRSDNSKMNSTQQLVEFEKVTVSLIPKTIETKRLTRGRLHAALTDVVGLPCRAVDLVGPSESMWGYYAHWKQLFFDSGLDLMGGREVTYDGELSFLSDKETIHNLWLGIFESLWLPESDPRNWDDRVKQSLTSVQTGHLGREDCRLYSRGEIMYAKNTKPKRCNVPLGHSNAMQSDLWPGSARSKYAYKQSAQSLINDLLMRRLRAVCKCRQLWPGFGEFDINMRQMSKICFEGLKSKRSLW